jgi:hypothetical protein
MKWAMHVACVGELRNHTKFLFANPEGKNHSEDVGVDGIILLEWIVEKQGGKL